MTDKGADKQIRVYADLIGDLFHAGHLAYLEKARSTGNVLVVGLFSDETSALLSHTPVMTLDERVTVVSALRCVDEVVPAAPIAPDVKFLDQYDIDHACLGNDYAHAGRQAALAALLDQDAGIVLPYTESLHTADIVARITGEAPETEPSTTNERATVHPSAGIPTGDAAHQILAAQTATLEALGAIAAADFGRTWLMERDHQGSPTWVAFLRCLARNEIEVARPRETDPRFVSALSSMVADVTTPEDDVVLIGPAAAFVGSTLAASDRHVSIVRPGMTAPSGIAAHDNADFSVIHTGWHELPDAMPASHAIAIFNPAASAVLLMDGELLLASTQRLKNNLIVAVDFSPAIETNFHPWPGGDVFVFTDAFVRNVLHSNGFYEVEDILTTVDGMPKPDGAVGCGRRSRHSMVDEEKHGGNFRYLDANPGTIAGRHDEGHFIRWYRASKMPIEASGHNQG